MTSGTPDRLDRIEALLERVAVQQARNTDEIANFRQAMGESFRDTFDLIGVMAQQVEQNTGRVEQLEQERQETSQRFENLLGDARADRERQQLRHEQWLQQVQADRESNAGQFQAALELIRTLFLEVQRIWQRINSA